MKKSLKIAVVLLSMYGATNLAAANGSKMSDIFSYDMIGADVTYLESLIGPARKTNTDYQTKTYVVDSCELQVGYDGLNITTLSVETGGKCNFILKDVISFQENVPTNKLAFGLASPADYYSDCFIGCGNAYDPAIHELYIGSHAENWREILISSINASAGQWQDKMMAEQGEEWVMENRFNCNPQKYNDIAAKSMQGQHAERIMIGYGLEEKAQLQRGCDEPFESRSVVQSTEVNQGSEKLMEVPFQLINQEGDYYQYIGSQVLSGQFLYEPNDMDGYQFEFEIYPHEQEKLPKNAVMQRFTLENITKENATMYLGIKTDLTDPRFEANNCAVTGPVTLQIVGISLDIPKDAHWYMSMKPSKVIQAGPFRMGCEEM